MIQQIQSMCSDCHGQGERFSAKDRCKNCNGHKVERKKKILEVHIDKGVRVTSSLSRIPTESFQLIKFPNAETPNKCKLLPTGMKDGQKITFHGEGDQEPGLEPGDVIIVLDQKEHAIFQRQGNNLLMKLEIKLVEALCGFKKAIRTLDNRMLLISSPPGQQMTSCLKCPVDFFL